MAAAAAVAAGGCGGARGRLVVGEKSGFFWDNLIVIRVSQYIEVKTTNWA